MHINNPGWLMIISVSSQIIAAVVTWLITALVAYGAVKQDIAAIKVRQELMGGQLNRIESRVDDLYKRK